MKDNFFSLKKLKKEMFSKEFRCLVFQVFKKEYKIFGLLALLIFFIIGFGQIISTVGSRSIIEPINVIASDSRGDNIQSFSAIMQLARSNNYSLMINGTATKESKEYWSVAGAFIKKIIIVVSNTDLATLESVDILIGDKKFHFTGKHLTRDWSIFDKTLVSSFLPDINYNDYLVLEAPSEVSLVKSKIPIYKGFFSSLINWSGDDKILGNSLKNTISLGLLVIVFLIILRLSFILFKFYQPDNSISEDDISCAKSRFIIYFFVIVSTILVIILLNSLIYYLYTPNITDIVQEASTTYITRLAPFLIPKPVERMQFMLSVLFSPFVIYFFYYWFSKKKSVINQLADRWYLFVVALSIFLVSAIVYWGMAMSNFFYIQDSFYFSSAGKYFYSLIIFPLVLLFFLMKDTLPKKVNTILITLACFSLAVVFFMNIVNLFNVCISHVFDPVIYPVSQVVAGKSLLVNLTSLYGLYPFFLMPIFKIIGLSVLKFSFLMSLLVVVSLVFLFEFMRRIVNNKFIFLLGFLNVVFYSLLATRISPDQYFQYWPIRFVFPCLGLFLMAIYFKTENKYIYYFSFLIYSAGILWNFDAGVIVYLSWLAVLLYNELARGDSRRMTILFCITKHLVVGFLAFIFTVGCFALSTYLISGHLPDFSLFLQYQKIFLSGYLMVKILLPPHAWNLIVLIYLIGLMLSVRFFIKKQVGYAEKIIFVLTIMGIGLFSYYEGQSLDVTLFRVSYPALILIVIFVDNLNDRIRKYGIKIYGEVAIFICLFYVILSAPFSLLYNSKKYFNLIAMGLSNFNFRHSTCFDNIGFIKQYTTPKENILILANYSQGIYYAETQTRSIVDIPSIPDIIFPSEINSVINFLKFNKEAKVFVQKPLENYNMFDIQIKKILKERYLETAQSENNFSLYQAK